MKWIMSLWYRRQRRIDMEVLWPACWRQAPSLHDAKAAFAMHAYHDPAWLFLGEDAIYETIDRLNDKGE